MAVNGPVAFNIVVDGEDKNDAWLVDRRRALLGRSQDRQGNHGRQDRGPAPATSPTLPGSTDKPAMT